MVSLTTDNGIDRARDDELFFQVGILKDKFKPALIPAAVCFLELDVNSNRIAKLQNPIFGVERD